MQISNVLAAAVLLAAATRPALAQPPGGRDAAAKPQVPTVVVAGCVTPTAEPHIWLLTNAGERSDSTGSALTAAEREGAAKRELGTNRYELIGIADFVTVEDSLKIGNRKDLYPPERVNASGVLQKGFKVTVKGLLAKASPPRINVTSALKLAETCP